MERRIVALFLVILALAPCCASLADKSIRAEVDTFTRTIASDDGDPGEMDAGICIMLYEREDQLRDSANVSLGAIGFGIVMSPIASGTMALYYGTGLTAVTSTSFWMIQKAESANRLFYSRECDQLPLELLRKIPQTGADAL